MNNSLISIIIVNYNSGNYLRDCVQSILTNDQTCEIFVVDNASTDNSLQLLTNAVESSSQLTIIKNKKNLGFSAGNNKALAHARGEYVLFLNPDCVIKAGVLPRMREVMQQNPKVAMSGCLIRNSDESIQATCVRSIPTPWNSLVRVLHLNKIFPQRSLFKGLDLASQQLPQKMTAVEGISGAFMFVRHTALKEIGNLDEGYFLYCEDVDWMMRFQQAGWQILFVPDVEIIHAKSVSSRQIPLRVLWYKHYGMTRFYWKFFRQRYSVFLLILVYLAIWTRFVGLIFLTLLRMNLRLFRIISRDMIIGIK